MKDDAASVFMVEIRAIQSGYNRQSTLLRLQSTGAIGYDNGGLQEMEFTQDTAQPLDAIVQNSRRGRNVPM
jgi:hypothetical protein